MKLKYLWKISLDNDWRQGLRSFLNTVLYIIGMTVIGVMVFLISTEADIKKSMDEALRSGIEHFGYAYCEIPTSEYDKNSDFNIAETVNELDCVAYATNEWLLSGLEIAGKWSLEYKGSKTISENLDILQNIQDKNVYNPFYAALGARLEVIYLSANAYQMFHINLYKGNSPENLDYSSDAVPIYLGYKYKNAVEPGTIISNGKDTYVVAGILEKKSTMPVECTALISMDEEASFSSYVLDYSILLMPDDLEGTGVDCFFSLADGYTFDDVRNSLEQIMSDTNSIVYVESVAEHMEAISNKMDINSMYDIFVFVIVIICLVLSCFQINTILSQRKDYGVLFACGLSHRDIVKMAFIDNIKKVVIAILIMFCVVAGKLTAEIKLETMTAYMLKETLYGRLIIIVLAVGTGLTLVVSLIPAIILKKASPIELIGGK
ncbi:MAG: ABC transporter permease [Coprococcus sp.]|nr:ABC transporter permease [Coprococcus sp.]